MRIELGLTQAELADRAGIGKRTIERIEDGCDTQLATLIRLLRVLGLSDRLDQLVPAPTITPMEMLKGQAKPPKRAKRKRVAESGKSWKWGDDK